MREVHDEKCAVKKSEREEKKERRMKMEKHKEREAFVVSVSLLLTCTAHLDFWFSSFSVFFLGCCSVCAL